MDNNIMSFGKYKGKKLDEILTEDPSYIIWLDENKIIEVSEELLISALSNTMPPDFEDLHNDWGNRD